MHPQSHCWSSAGDIVPERGQHGGDLPWARTVPYSPAGQGCAGCPCLQAAWQLTVPCHCGAGWLRCSPWGAPAGHRGHRGGPLGARGHGLAAECQVSVFCLESCSSLTAQCGGPEPSLRARHGPQRGSPLWREFLAVSQNPAGGCFCQPVASRRRGGRGQSTASSCWLLKLKVPGEAVLAPRPPGAAWGTHRAGLLVMVCHSSPHTATVSAWRPGVLRQRPRTSPGSVGMSRPQRQPSSRDPSSKSRCFTCSLTGTRRLGWPEAGGGQDGLWRPSVCQAGCWAFLQGGHLVAESVDPRPPGFRCSVGTSAGYCLSEPQFPHL